MILTVPLVEISISKTTVPRGTPLRASDAGNVAEPCRSSLGMPSSSVVLKRVLTVGVGCGFVTAISGGLGNGGGAKSVKKFSTGVVMSIGTVACGMGTRVGSGNALTCVSEGGGGGRSGGGSSSGGGGGGSMVAVSNSLIVRSGVMIFPVNKRENPNTANRAMAAQIPRMMALRFKVNVRWLRIQRPRLLVLQRRSL